MTVTLEALVALASAAVIVYGAALFDPRAGWLVAGSLGMMLVLRRVR